MFHSEHVEVRGQLEESVLSYLVVPGNQIQVIRLNSGCLYPLSHLYGQQIDFKVIIKTNDK